MNHHSIVILLSTVILQPVQYRQMFIVVRQIQAIGEAIKTFGFICKEHFVQ